MHRTGAGAYYETPHAANFAIDADNLGIAPVVEGRINWLSAAGEPLLDAIPTFIRSHRKRVACRSVLDLAYPVSMQAEHTSPRSVDGALVV